MSSLSLSLSIFVSEVSDGLMVVVPFCAVTHSSLIVVLLLSQVFCCLSVSRFLLPLILHLIPPYLDWPSTNFFLVLSDLYPHIHNKQHSFFSQSPFSFSILRKMREMESERKMDSAEMECDGYKPRDVLNWRERERISLQRWNPSTSLTLTRHMHCLSVWCKKIPRTNGGDGVDVMTLTPHQ